MSSPSNAKTCHPLNGVRPAQGVQSIVRSPWDPRDHPTGTLSSNNNFDKFHTNPIFIERPALQLYFTQSFTFSICLFPGGGSSWPWRGLAGGWRVAVGSATWLLRWLRTCPSGFSQPGQLPYLCPPPSDCPYTLFPRLWYLHMLGIPDFTTCSSLPLIRAVSPPGARSQMAIRDPPCLSGSLQAPSKCRDTSRIV